MELTKLNVQEEAVLTNAGFNLAAGNDAKRWQQLEQAYISSGLWRPSEGGYEFACANSETCSRLFCSENGIGIRSDHRGTVANYFAAGYDRLYSTAGLPIRICLASIDSGNWTFDFDKQTSLDSRSGLDFNNPHWRETRKTMYYLLFGSEPSNVGQTRIVLKLFTHIRSLKCNGGTNVRTLDGRIADASEDSRKWKRPDGMYQRCLNHLVAELSILEPTIIIAHGYKSPVQLSRCTIHSIIQAMDELCTTRGRNVSDRLLPQTKERIRFAAYTWDTPWGNTLLLGVDHPNNGVGYWPGLRNGLKPAIDVVRRRSFDISGL